MYAQDNKRLFFEFLTLLFYCQCADHEYNLCCTEDYSVGDEVRITVYGTWNSITARAMAEEHCKKYSRSENSIKPKRDRGTWLGIILTGKCLIV